MKPFLLKLFVFCSLVILPYIYIQYGLMLEHESYYWKSAYSADHLVLGCSRAQKGIFPHILVPELNLEGTMLNFAFNGLISPYGPEYTQAIKRKLRSPEHPGVFILSVSPSAIMDFVAAKEAREKGFRFYNLWDMNQHPNIEYVLRHPKSGPSLLTEWLSRNKRGRDKRIYKDGSNATYLPKDHTPPPRPIVLPYALKKSPLREASLQELVHFLANRGKVFLVRIPVSEQALKEEKELYPGFDERMKDISNESTNAWYLDFPNATQKHDYRFIDGNQHLDGDSADKFSLLLAARIQKVLREK